MSIVIKPMPETVNLRGCSHRVAQAEGLIVFSEEDPIWSCGQRSSFRRVCGCWHVSIEGQMDYISISHIVRAYEIVSEVYGGDFKFENGEYNP